MSKWDERFLALAKHVSSWSKDPGTQVGAVIVDDLHRVVGLGYNGFPRGIQDTEERLRNRPIKLVYVVHAELNAILNAQKTEGMTLYVWPMPCCANCAKHIIQAGIKRVVAVKPTEEQWHRWQDEMALAEGMYKEAGVQYDII